MASGGQPMTKEQVHAAESAPAIFSIREGQTPQIAHREGTSIVLRSSPEEDGVALLEHLRRRHPEEFRKIIFPPDWDLATIDVYAYFDHKDASIHGFQMLQWVLKEASRINGKRLADARRISDRWKAEHSRLFEQSSHITKKDLRLSGLCDVDDEILDDVIELLKGLKSGDEEDIMQHSAGQGEQTRRERLAKGADR